MKLTQRKVSGGNEYSISGSPDERKYLEGEITEEEYEKIKKKLEG